MKKLFVSLLVLPIVCSCININFSSKSIRCKGPVETRAIEVEGGFSKLEMNGGFDIVLVNADSCSVSVEANEDAFEWLVFDTKDDGTLVLETKDHVTIMAEKCEITISAPVFTQINVNGAVDLEYDFAGSGNDALAIEVNGAGDMELSKFAGPSLDVTVNGAADLDLEDITAQSLSVTINGAGDVTVSGEVDDASFSVNGAGSIDASSLNVKNTPKVHKGGIADVKLAK